MKMIKKIRLIRYHRRNIKRMKQHIFKEADSCELPTSKFYPIVKSYKNFSLITTCVIFLITSSQALILEVKVIDGFSIVSGHNFIA
jgi:hypothetical protein